MDNLLKNFAEYLQGLQSALHLTEEHVIDGKTYTSGQALKQVWPDPLPPAEPQIPTFEVGTLSGAVALVVGELEAKQPKDMLFHIVSPTKVSLVMRQSDAWKRRLTLVCATMPAYQGFPFGKYIDHEDFVVGLQQHFVAVDDPASDFHYVARVSATVTASAVTISENDGISQQVAVKRSVNSGMKDFAELRRVVTLAPYRTFMEVPQPASTFLFRAKDCGEGTIPQLGLFECDGGMWRKLAMVSIKEYLKDQMSGTTFDIPIIC